MSSLVRHQDLPPPGGYKPIPYIRMPAKRLFKPWHLVGMYAAMTAGGFYLYGINHHMVKNEEIESRSAKMAMIPLLAAEYDRETLKQLRRNRDEEAKLMADVPGWKVGTWYGQPIYKTVPKDVYRNPTQADMHAHVSPKDILYVEEFHLWT